MNKGLRRFSSRQARQASRCLRAVIAAVLLAGALWQGIPAPCQESARTDAFYLLPVRIHLLHAAHVPDLTTQLQFADARRILGEINRIWRPAGVQFFADSLVREPAAAEDLFHMFHGEADEAQLRIVRPGESRSAQMFHVYYIHRMRPNGVTLLDNYQLIFVKDRPELDPVPGGTREPLARVTAHEFGHALDLDHTTDKHGLMASGTTGTQLSAAEIATARTAAQRLSWRQDPAGVLARADQRAATDRVGAADLYRVLAALPEGVVTQAAREHLAKLLRP